MNKFIYILIILSCTNYTYSALISIAAALSKNNVIGKENKIPWHLPEDLKRFRSITINKPCIMGRKTWESLPKKPLPNRTNIIITSQKNYSVEGAIVTSNLDNAIKIASENNPDEIMIIGGQSIYKEALDISDKLYLTFIDQNIEGDTYMPDIEWSEWEEESIEGPFTSKTIHYTYKTLVRKK